MKRYVLSALVLLAFAATVIAVVNGIRKVKGSLTGYEEVPAVSTVASGDFKATINDEAETIDWDLSYSDLEGNVTQAHIHVGQAGANGGISVWLCGNAGPGIVPPAGTQTCPPSPATISGTLAPANVVGPNAQGIAPGEFAELLAAIRAGKTYANVHTSKFPGGEVRSQLGPGKSNHPH